VADRSTNSQAAVFLLSGLTLFDWYLNVRQSNHEQVIAVQPAPA
jgi:hypothetical protein